MNSTFTTASLESVATEDKTAAILSYLMLIGFIVAVVLHGTKKTRLGAFHLRQSLGLLLTSVGVGVVATVVAFVPLIGWMVALTAWIGLLALWLTGLVAAINGERKPLPVVGAHFQHWFGNAFD